MPNKTSASISLKAIFYVKKDVFSDCYVNKYGKLSVFGAVFVYSGQLRALQLCRSERLLPCFLLVA